MKSMVFDAGPIISLAMNDLLWLLEELKKSFKGEFYISVTVKEELVDKPLSTKKFKFEALQVLKCINDGILTVITNDEIKNTTLHLLDLANNSFKAYNNPIRIVHQGEIEGLASSLFLESGAFVVDERTTRILIENPKRLWDILKNSLHTKIDVDEHNLDEFQSITKATNVIRSVELVTVAYELGLLNKYLANIENPKRTLLESVLWGVKLNGCAVSRREIDEIIKLEKQG